MPCPTRNNQIAHPMGIVSRPNVTLVSMHRSPGISLSGQVSVPGSRGVKGANVETRFRSGEKARRTTRSTLAFAALCAVFYIAGARAQTVEELQRLSIEDLTNVEITSVSKRPEPLSQAPAAVYVISGPGASVTRRSRAGRFDRVGD